MVPDGQDVNQAIKEAAERKGYKHENTATTVKLDGKWVVVDTDLTYCAVCKMRGVDDSAATHMVLLTREPEKWIPVCGSHAFTLNAKTIPISK